MVRCRPKMAYAEEESEKQKPRIRIEMRVTSSKKRRWLKAARQHKPRLSLSSWIKLACEQQAVRTLSPRSRSTGRRPR